VAITISALLAAVLFGFTALDLAFGPFSGGEHDPCSVGSDAPDIATAIPENETRSFDYARWGGVRAFPPGRVCHAYTYGFEGRLRERARRYWGSTGIGGDVIATKWYPAATDYLWWILIVSLPLLFSFGWRTLRLRWRWWSPRSAAAFSLDSREKRSRQPRSQPK
jgi:hypothetical protein